MAETETLELTPVPVGPTGLVEFAELEKCELAPVPVGPTTADVFVIGAEWVWMIAVPFSVQRLVKVVYCVSLEETPVPVGLGVVEFAL